MSSWNDGSSGQNPDQPQNPPFDPQYQNPQYQQPQYQNPQYPNPQYQSPQYPGPQNPGPQNQNPQYPGLAGGGPSYPQGGGWPGQPAYPYAGPRQAPSSGMNGLAIAGFVTAFFCSLVGLVLSIVAYNQCKQRRQSGQGLALAGIIISILSLIAGVIILAGR